MLDAASHANEYTEESVSSATVARLTGNAAMAKLLAVAMSAPIVAMTKQEAADLAVDDEGDDTPSDDFRMWLATQAPSA